MIRSSSLKIFLFLLPTILVVGVFFIVPVILTTLLGFTGMDYHFQWNFIGLGNYVKMTKDFLIPRILLNTVVYVFVTLICFNTTFGLVLAILTSSINKLAGLLFKILWLIPRFTPPVVYASIWLWFLSPTERGLLNKARAFFDLEPVTWISSHPWGVIIVSGGIIGASFGMIIFAAAIESIPVDYFRAARVDGASWLQEIRYVTLPLIRWPFLFVTAYQTLSLLTSYEYILLITQGGPYYASEVWSLYSYDKAFSSFAGTFEFGYAAAMATILVIIGIVASVIYWRLFKFKEMITEPPIEIV